MSIDLTERSAKSPLISEELQSQLQTLLARVQQPVTVICLADAGEKSSEMLSFLKHFTGLCPSLSLRALSPGEDAVADRALDAALLPATGFCRGQEFCRAVFHGVPGGKELTGFVSALLAFTGTAKPLDKPTLKDIARIKKPAKVQICVSLGCTHCAKTVMCAQRIAQENPLITAHMIDANLYPELVKKYQIERVPVLLVDGEEASVGGQTMPEICTILRKR
ncbi:MAG: thioredoxin family protein [Oscillospiraceae bacterium]|jgi:alkyl hydroperoxide reductase subunit AhpF|nr:thioredoxin family protein [Oscillospiraceae bacterium]MDD3260670.1 thioredoxin family protein [Oscillospiraceae bacterium]